MLTKSSKFTRILLIVLLFFAVISVLLAATMQNKENHRIASMNQSTVILDTHVSNETINKILQVSDDNYVGKSEKQSLQAYVNRNLPSASSVSLVDNLVSSAYQKGIKIYSALPDFEKTSTKGKAFKASLDRMSHNHDIEQVPTLISDYVNLAKKL